jgi:RHS repeat-associated protein
MAYGLTRGGHPGRSSTFRLAGKAGWRIASTVVLAGLVGQALVTGAPAAQAAARAGSSVGSTQTQVQAPTPSTPVTPVVSHYTKPVPETSWQAPKPAWPSGTASVTLAGATHPQAVGTLPVTLAAAPATPAHTSATATVPAESSPLTASVTAQPQSASTALGIKGLVLSVARTDGTAQSSQAQITVSYAGFKDAFGGDYGPRLALVGLPACALTTPAVPACRTQSPVAFTNNGQAQTLTATVTLPAAAQAGHSDAATTAPVAGRSADAVAKTGGPASELVLAIAPDTSSASTSGGGSYSATSLSAAGSWSAGGSTDAFTYSYPIAAPAVPGGLAPSLSLAYDSQSLDGLTSNTNNQAGDFGDGWDLTDSYIERGYASCHQNPAGPTQTQDNCWSTNNQLTLDLNGQTSTLIKDDKTGAYHAQDDQNELVTYNSSNTDGVSAVNGAQNGEYWVVTTPNGTQYYFGLDELPGYATGDATTNSVDLEPVYATASGQPCYNSTFSKSYCEQAYRWNLDYVVDAHSNALSYWYNTTTGYYAMDNGATAPAASAYTRDSYLSKIQYGQTATQIYTSTPEAQVTFTVNGRCSSVSTGCAVSTISSNPTNFPDIPYDLNCASGASCTSQSPSFWSENEVTTIQTQALVGSTLTNVDSWALTYALPAVPKGDTSSPTLWLSTIAQTGQDTSAEPSGASSLPLPPVTFAGTYMQNRVNLGDGYPWISRQRLTGIVTETGEKIAVGYSQPACGTSTPSNDAQNTMLCYPVYWYPTITNSPTKDYFNKYIVTYVSEQDATGGSGNDTIETTYTPVGNPAWHYNDNPLTPTAQDTWDQFRGYPGMIVSTGTAPDPITETEYKYFQGMDGDYLSSTSTRTATVSDANGHDPAVSDLDQYAGMTYETQVFNGSALVTDTIDTPWTSAATATHALPNGVPSQQAFMVDTAEEQVYTPLASGATQETEKQYTHDAYGRVIQINNLGDVTQPSQNLCTTTTYDDNTSAWILDVVAETKTVSVDCSTTPVYPTDAVSDLIDFYDGNTTSSAPPTHGDETEAEEVLSYTNTGSPIYTVMSQYAVDSYGRVTSSTDADGRVTKTAYTPTTGAEPTSIAVTDPMNMTTTTTYDPLRNLPTQITTPGGFTTVNQYNALGQIIAVFNPGFPTSGPPNLKYTYAMSASVPSVVDTYTLNDDQTYRVSESIYDSMLRLREIQVATADGGRNITDTYYNTDGWESESTSPYYNSAAVSAAFVQQQVGDLPSVTGYTYDGVGRKTAQIALNNGNQSWETTYTYGGNFVTTVPPAGETPETTVTDARGNQTDLIQYLSGKPTNYVTDPTSDYTDTKYTFYPNGKPATEADPAGNQWSWTYNLLGDALTSSDPDTGTTTDTYDSVGQLISTTDQRNKQTTYVYDKDGRKTASYDTTGGAGETSGDEVASWVYDTVKKGYLTSSTSYSNGDTYTSSTLAYNSMGDPSATKVTLTGTDAALVPATGYTTSYTYTFSGLLAFQDDPAMGGLPAENLQTTYNEVGQPIKLATNTGTSWTYVSAVGYNENDQALNYTMPTVGGTVKVGMTYDPQTSALDTIQTTASTDSAPVDNLTYVYGNSLPATSPGYVSPGSGLITQVDDSQNGGSTVDTQCFTYDYAGQLAQAWTATDQCAATPGPGNSSTVGGTDAPYWQSWTYDAAGDRSTETDHDVTGNTSNDTITTYNYPPAGSATDQPNTLTNTTATGPNAAAESATYQYNATGEETSQTGGAPGSQTYTWNDQDKLQYTTTSAGTTNYVYDASGNQIVMRDPSSSTLTMGDFQLTLNGGTLSAIRYYSIDGAIIAERTSAGGVSVLVPDRQNTDQLAISTSAAQTVTRRQYLPFGGVRGTQTTWVAGLKGYIGGNTDPITGLETLGARLYDDADGRFLCADPVFEAADPTQMGGYDYSGNDPVTAEDPSGDMFMAAESPYLFRRPDKVSNPGVQCIKNCGDPEPVDPDLDDTLDENLGELPSVVSEMSSDEDFLATLKVFANYYNSVPNGQGYTRFSVLIQQTDVQVDGEVVSRVVVYSSSGTIPENVLNALPKSVPVFKATGSSGTGPKDAHFEDAQATLEDDPQLQDKVFGGQLGDIENEFGTAMPCSESCSELSGVTPGTYGNVNLPGIGQTELTGGRGTVLSENWGNQSWNGDEDMPNKPINQLICALQGNPTNAEIAQAAINAEISQEVSSIVDGVNSDQGIGEGEDLDDMDD